MPHFRGDITSPTGTYLHLKQLFTSYNVKMQGIIQLIPSVILSVAQEFSGVYNPTKYPRIEKQHDN